MVLEKNSGRTKAEARRMRQRHAPERQKLIDEQLEQCSVLQREFKLLRQQRAMQLLDLQRDVSLYLGLTRSYDVPLGQQRQEGSELTLGR